MLQSSTKIQELRIDVGKRTEEMEEKRARLDEVIREHEARPSPASLLSDFSSLYSLIFCDNVIFRVFSLSTCVFASFTSFPLVSLYVYSFAFSFHSILPRWRLCFVIFHEKNTPHIGPASSILLVPLPSLSHSLSHTRNTHTHNRVRVQKLLGLKGTILKWRHFALYKVFSAWSREAVEHRERKRRALAVLSRLQNLGLASAFHQWAGMMRAEREHEAALAHGLDDVQGRGMRMLLEVRAHEPVPFMWLYVLLCVCVCGCVFVIVAAVCVRA